MFANESFDFILFSFNGIDYIPHEDRLIALQEIKRVCKKGGFFCFSAHNLQHVDRILKIEPSANPIRMLWNLSGYLLIRILNKSIKKLEREKYAIIKDAGHRFRSRTYYIKPQEQIKQLEETGYKNIRVYSLSDGQEIVDQDKLSDTSDGWLYYLCSTETS